MRIKICIVGSGINGLASAFCIGKKFPECSVEIVAADYPPNTTSDHGFGIVMNSIKNASLKSSYADEYVQLTVKHCQQMDSVTAKLAGVQFVPTTLLTYEKDDAKREYSRAVRNGSYDCRVLSQAEMAERGYVIENKKLERIFKCSLHKSEYLKAYEGHFAAIDTSLYLPWLMKQLQLFLDKNGKKRVVFLKRKLSNLNELSACDLIVNCSGLGARQLAADDLVIPIRGQYLQVDLPRNRCFYSEGGSIVPRFNDLCLGAIKQMGRWDLEVDPNDTETILKVSEVTLPEIRKAKILKIGVALRPGRIGGTRVELEKSSDGKHPPIIHNYGHGAGGISQHWGCALKVVELAMQTFPRSHL